jgi:predicted Kef-type K+ transport protein
MHENFDLILTLTGGLGAALAFGYVTHRLGLSPIVGYLLAGILVGPYSPGFVADKHMAEQFAEVGVILLLFGVGLHFRIEDLIAVRKVALPGAVVQTLAAAVLGAGVAGAFGWSWPATAVFGLSVSVASTVVFALGNAVGAALLFGASMALGAFLAGMVVGRSDFSLRAATDALPMRDAFAVLFFVSVGMLFDPAFLLQSPGLVAATLAVIMLGTPLVACGVVLLLRLPFRSALRIGFALAQIGEFSFILARLGMALGVLPDDALQAIVAVAIVSISLNPLLYRLADLLGRWVGRSRRAAEPSLEQTAAALSNVSARENKRHRAGRAHPCSPSPEEWD